MIYIFYEFSDWRNSLFWWVSDIILKKDFNIELHIRDIIYSLIKNSFQNKSCGLRVIVYNEEELKLTLLKKSSYIIYQKSF